MLHGVFGLTSLYHQPWFLLLSATPDIPVSLLYLAIIKEIISVVVVAGIYIVQRPSESLKHKSKMDSLLRQAHSSH
jgi:hypothetical protein